MSGNSDYNALKGDRKAIAAIASATVDGYLRNVSRRHRVPDVQGGRGTRRKLAIVTSTTAAEQPAPVVDADDEWDEVDLPAVPVKKQEAMKHDEAAQGAGEDRSAADVKGEAVAAVLPVVKDEQGAMVMPAPIVGAKRETLVIDGDDSADATRQQPIHVDDASLPPGSRPPLCEQPSRTMWRQRGDPAYEAMREQMDQAEARRRSERVHRTCVAIVSLISVLLRGRLLWRESRHPQLLRALLRIQRVERESASEPERKKAKSNTTRAGDDAVKPRRDFVLSRAVTVARKAARESAGPKYSKPSLAPAWVTIPRDAVRNKTSEAIMTLLHAINDTFELQIRKSPGDSVTEAEELAAASMTDWAAAISPGFLMQTLRDGRELPIGSKIALPHTLYFSVIFLALASMARLECRLVVAKQVEAGSAESPEREGDAAGDTDEPTRPKLARMSVFGETQKRKKRDRQGDTGGDVAGDVAAGAQVKSKRQPSSCFWTEVWSQERGSFVAVNPCIGCTTLWGAPFTFSIAGDVAVDVSARYTSKFSAAFSFNRRIGRVSSFGFLWKDKLKWDDNREISEVLLGTFSKDATAKTRERMPREQKQLESLAYSEPVPTTLTALHKHPLFVIEAGLARHEGIYPKDASTMVGRVKGHTVYKRSAVVSLRSRDGWLREGRCIRDGDEAPYKQVPPSASRPFAAPSMFFGLWQTKPFEPLPLRADSSIPHHGRTSWYILLGAPPPPGLVHLTQPQLARVARRMQLDFGLAVLGFHKRRVSEHRRGHWEAVIDGIVVREADKSRLLHAYEEWVQLVQEQEAAKRRDRALRWWLLLIQRRLSMDRLRAQYLDGAMRGSLPTW